MEVGVRPENFRIAEREHIGVIAGTVSFSGRQRKFDMIFPDHPRRIGSGAEIQSVSAVGGKRHAAVQRQQEGKNADLVKHLGL